MSCRKQIGNISFHTDDDTGMYSVGELDGGWHTELLENYIKNYGVSHILVHLAYMANVAIECNRKLSNVDTTECGMLAERSKQ